LSAGTPALAAVVTPTNTGPKPHPAGAVAALLTHTSGRR
jgi:hypothetical protein